MSADPSVVEAMVQSLRDHERIAANAGVPAQDAKRLSERFHEVAMEHRFTAGAGLTAEQLSDWSVREWRRLLAAALIKANDDEAGTVLS